MTFFFSLKSSNVIAFLVIAVIQQALTITAEYQTMGSFNKPSATTPTARSHGNNISWNPPTNGVLKLNVDAHPSGDGRWGLAIVLKTEEGKCVGAATLVVSGSSITLEGEALSLKVAIDFAQAYPNDNITIEMDSNLIVDAVKNQTFSRNYWGRISRYCASTLQSNPKRSISWTRRSGNKAAHVLANWAFSEPNRTWVNDTPLCIQDIIQKDISICIPVFLSIIIIFFQKKKTTNFFFFEDI
jgi:ribonuclease HI